MSSRILTITLNPSVDVSGEADVLRPVHKIRISNPTYEAGGGGINAAGVIANLGGDVTCAYVTGGATGSMLKKILKEKPFKTLRIKNDAPVRIAFNVMEESSGFEYRFVPKGEPISPEAIDATLAAISDFDGEYVVASGSLPAGAPDDLLVQMADIVNAKGARFVLDSSGEALHYTMEHAKIFLAKPSLSEMRAICGKDMNEETARQSAMNLINRGHCELLAITLGSQGAMMADESGVLRLPALHVKTRSTVGAGDSFLGAMVWALSEDWSREDAFKLGVAAGAAAAMTAGTQLCSRDEIMRLYEIVQSTHSPT